MSAFLDSDGSFPARIAVIAAFALATAFAGVISMPPLDRDEARFAQATAQMLETGDFVSIRFQDEERNKKPVGIHWLQAASVSAFSSAGMRDIWAYRLPSVVGAVLAALFTYAAGAQLFGSRVGFLSALLMASAPAMAAEATIAKTDAALLACVTGAQALLISIYAAAIAGRHAPFAKALGFWVAIGAGVLIKGPIILIVIVLTCAGLALRGDARKLLPALRPILGLAILILTVSPWAFAINAATEGRFFEEAIGGDMLAKISTAQESHSGPPGYYALLLFALFWPAAALIVPGIRLAVRQRSDWRFWFLISWIAPSWLAFELTATKLPHYTLPLYPAIAILAAAAAARGVDSTAMRRIGAGIHVAVGFAFAGIAGALPQIYSEPALVAYAVVSAAAIAAASLAAGFLFIRGRSIESAALAAMTSAALAWTLLGGVLPNLDQLRISPRLSAAIDAADLHPLRDDAPPAILSGYYEPSAIFLLGTSTRLAGGVYAADLFAESNGVAAVESREDAAFRTRLNAVGVTPEAFGTISGTNYSNGKDVTISLYRHAAGRGDGQEQK
jgi:4-amino-4-deoxy-L-arabinose transferase-like glycosyltransferase